MHVGVLGAGVIGSIFAHALVNGGHQVTAIARGRRLADIQKHGLRLQTWGSKAVSSVDIDAVDHLEVETAFDVLLVCVQSHQIEAVLPVLKGSRARCIVFCCNQFGNTAEIAHQVGRDRTLWLFPAALGEIVDGVVHARVLSSLESAIQVNTLGVADSAANHHIETVRQLWKSIGLPLAVTKHLDAWLQTHTAFMLPIMWSGLSAPNRKAFKPDLTLSRHVSAAVKELLALVRGSDAGLAPWNMKVVSLTPDWMIALVYRLTMATPMGVNALYGHVEHGRDEMVHMLAAIRKEAASQNRELVALERLISTV